jgi:hypothetical protein
MYKGRLAAALALFLFGGRIKELGEPGKILETANELLLGYHP